MNTEISMPRVKSNVVKINELDKLAKLLSTEDIIIEHTKVATASFDIVNRILTLPMWQDMTRELYHMLVLHEIGHALYTTPQSWKDAVNEFPGIKDTINVIEDARIERMVKVKYAGSRRDFRIGYKELFDRDFFKTQGKDIAKYGIIDRVNLHYKLGEHITIPFSTKETVLLVEIDNAKTMIDVVAIAKKLYNAAKEEKQEKSQQDAAAAADSNGETMPSDNQDMSPADADDKQSSDDIQSSSDESAENSTDKCLDNGEPKAETAQALEDNLRGMINTSVRDNKYYNIDNTFNCDDYIITYSKLLSSFGLGVKQYMKPIYNEIRAKNIRMIDYLVKEFEVRKAADQYSRTRDAKTGVINPNKLHSYKMVDDIFRRISITPNSKNHGIIMYVDFSGSMSPIMNNVIEQLMCLVLFCRKVNIPHRVYAFSDAATNRPQKILGYNKSIAIKNTIKRNTIIPNPQLKLLELFHEKMNGSNVADMMEYLFNRFPNRASRIAAGGSTFYHDLLSLNSTPLESAMVLARPMLRNFKKETNRQIISMVFLTDGEGDGAMVRDKDGSNKEVYYSLRGHSRDTVVRDPETHRNYNMSCQSMANILTTMLRDEGCHIVNFRIGEKRALKHQLHYYAVAFGGADAMLANSDKFINLNACIAKLAKDKILILKNFEEFDEYYMIMCDSLYIEDDDDYTFGENYNSKKMATAFIKANSSKRDSRVVLSSFAKMIAA